MRVPAALIAAFVAVGAAQQTANTTLRQPAQLQGAEPIVVLELERSWAGAEMLFALADESRSPQIRTAAVRAIGRLEDPRLIGRLLALKGITERERGDAIAQSLKGFDPAVDPNLVTTATESLFRSGAQQISGDRALAEVAGAAGALSRIHFVTPEQVHQVEQILVRLANYTSADPKLAGVYLETAQDFESLFRINTRVTGLDEEPAVRVQRMVRGASSNDGAVVRLHALMALMAGRALDSETARMALEDRDWQVRRAAMTVLAGGGAGLADDERLDLIAKGLTDSAFQVRYEALRGYVRRGARVRGCAPIDSMLDDESQHVVLAALDALGDLCKDDQDLTMKIAAAARVPPAVGSWHRETHAYVALAKRSPELAAPLMAAFATHPVWWVRMYTVKAAEALGDLARLEKLVFDSNPNVRDAALDPWNRLKKADAEPAMLDALKQTDVQLLRTAATLLKDRPKSDATYRALLDALRRLTKEGKETSRDARLPILDAIAVHASPDNANELEPWLQDFDPKVAEKAAQVMTGLSGKPALPNPQLYRRGGATELTNGRLCVSVQMASGRSFRLDMDPSVAPVTVERFLKLALQDRYYDGLTIHRIVPNFVVQGGSPNANEYSGAKEFMRDEVRGRNVRGTVGLSTRGRNTGDAQFFINLVDNPRLNPDYTVFARVGTGMDVVDNLQEGDVMRTMNVASCAR